MKKNKLFKENKNTRIIKILCILIIQVDISKSKHGESGPIILQRGISKVLPYETTYCKFIPYNGIYPNDIKNIDYFFITAPSINEKIYDKWIKINRVISKYKHLA